MTEGERLAEEAYAEGVAQGLTPAQIIWLLAEKLGMTHPAPTTKQ